MSSLSGVTLTAGQTAVVIYLGDTEPSQEVTEHVHQLQAQTSSIQLQTITKLANLPKSTFDAAFIFEPVSVNGIDLVAILNALKPNGVVCLSQLAIMLPSSGLDGAADKIRSVMTLNGFVATSAQQSTRIVSAEVRDQLKSPFDCREDLVFFNTRASKPGYEVGDSAPIKLKKPVDTSAAKAWTLNANDMVDDDILDSDAVLDADDLKKPDPASLRAACDGGPTQRKACKNCTCGLAEELELEQAKVKAAAEQQRTSSCGNCYLGDAFRCSSCPYRGMPAFKPGEKVALPASILQDDL